MKGLSNSEVPLLSSQIDNCVHQCEEQLDKLSQKSGDLTPFEIGEATKPFLQIEEERNRLSLQAQNYNCHSEDQIEEELVSEVEQAMLSLLNRMHSQSSYLYQIEN